MKADEILRELVAIATPSPVSNIPLLNWVGEFLKPFGWSLELFPYSDENGVAKANLLARPPKADIAAPIGLAFVCHTDTVPYASSWGDALRLHTGDSHLHGCGACDVKGSLAGFLAALAGIKETRADVALILTADEEVGCKGVERLLEATRLHIASAIVSEPTSLRPGIAGKGYGLARVTVHGVEAHSAYPTEGISAIVLAARFITEIAGRPSGSIDHDCDSLFDPSGTTLNVGTIEGGSAKNIVAGLCTFLVEWRPVPSEDPLLIASDLRQIAREIVEDHPRATIDVQILRAEHGFAPAAEGTLQEQLCSLVGSAPLGISFGSEASRLLRVADEVIVIGPGDMHTAHSDRECVPESELSQWTTILSELLRIR